MKQIVREYGGVIIASLVLAIVIGLVFTTVIAGESGMAAAAGSAAEYTGGADSSLSEASAVQAGTTTEYTITQLKRTVDVGSTIALSSIAITADSSAVASVAEVFDEDRNDAIASGKAVYNRSTHTITFTQRGEYDISIRFSGTILQREIVRVTAM